MSHRMKEMAQGGKELWPAKSKVIGEMRTGKLTEEEDFCSQLESCTATSELWW